jgi:hypothetical protein
MKYVLAVVVACVLVAGCSPKTVTVTTGHKVICSECGKAISSEVTTKHVPIDDASNYSVKETTELCSDCQKKPTNRITGLWHGQYYGWDTTINFRPGGTGFTTRNSWAGNQSDDIKWVIRGESLSITPAHDGRDIGGPFEFEEGKLIIHHSVGGTAVYSKN